MRHRHLLPLTERERHGQIRNLNSLYRRQRDLNEPLGSRGQIDSVVFTAALFYFWLFTLPHRCHLTGRLWKDPLPSFQDQEKISLLSCSKCFIQQMWKKKKKRIQERVDNVFVDLFLSSKEPNGQKSNLQSGNMRSCRNQSEEAGPSCSGSSGPLSLNAHQHLHSRVWFCCWWTQRNCNQLVSVYF